MATSIGPVDRKHDNTIGVEETAAEGRKATKLKFFIELLPTFARKVSPGGGGGERLGSSSCPLDRSRSPPPPGHGVIGLRAILIHELTK